MGQEREHKNTVTILTNDAINQIEPIHDRMPIMLEPDEEDTWLSTDDEAEMESLLDPHQDDDLQPYPISRAVNNPDNDTEEILEPVDVDDQARLGDF